MLQAYAYVLHLLSGFALLGAFIWIYTKVTPLDEIALIRQGNVAAALSLAGATVGFCLTIAAGILLNSTFFMFLSWAAGAMTAQVVTYAVVTRLLPQMNTAIAENNIAMGLLMGATSLSVGIINAACLS